MENAQGLPQQAFRSGLTPGSFPRQPLFTLQGLDDKPELNGAEVDVISLGTDGRWEVAVRGSQQSISASPANLRIDDCAGVKGVQREIKICGVVSRPEMNGQLATCDSFKADRGRWPVKLKDSPAEAPVLLQSKCLEDLASCSPIVDPFRIETKEMNGMKQKALVAATPFDAGDVLFCETAVVQCPSRKDVHIYDGFGQALKMFLGLPAEKRDAVLALHAHDTFGFIIDQRSLPPKILRSPRDPTGKDLTSLDRKEVVTELSRQGFRVPQDDIEDAWKFLRVFDTNSFTLAGRQALFLYLSRLNHSCLPNVYRCELPNGDFALVALAPIAAGEEICISYIPEWFLLEPTGLRQNRLSHWQFHCMCSRCKDPEDKLLGFLCFAPDKCSGVRNIVDGALMACSVCGDQAQPLPPSGPLPEGNEEKNVLKKEADLTELQYCIEETPSFVGYHNVQNTLLTPMKEVENIFPKTHWLQAKFHDFLRDLEDQRNNTKEALEHMRSVLHVFDAHFHRLSVRRALLRTTMAGLQLKLGNRLAALRIYAQALAELACLHPQNHEFCVDARRGIEKCING